MSRCSHFLLFLTINIFFEAQCKKLVLRTGDIVVKYLPNVDEEIKELTKVVQEIKDLPKGKVIKGIKVLPKDDGGIILPKDDRGMKDLRKVEAVNNLPKIMGFNNLPKIVGFNNLPKPVEEITYLPRVEGIYNLPKPVEEIPYLPKVEGIYNLPKPIEETKELPKVNGGNILMDTQIAFEKPNVQPIEKAPEGLNQAKPEKKKKVKGHKKHRVTKEILLQLGKKDFIEKENDKIEDMKKKVARIRNKLKARKKDNNIATKDEKHLKHPIMRTHNKDKNANHLKKKRKRQSYPVTKKLLRSRFAIETKTEKISSTVSTSYSPMTRKRPSNSDSDEPVMRGAGRHAEDDDDLNFDLEGEMLSQIV